MNDDKQTQPLQPITGGRIVPRPTPGEVMMPMPPTHHFAFPSTMSYDQSRPMLIEPGMTLLDYFAAAALPSLLDRYTVPREAVRDAYVIAQQMMAERAKRLSPAGEEL